MGTFNHIFSDPALSDTLINVLSHLQGQDLVLLRRVSKHFRQLVDSSARLRVIRLQFQLVAPPTSRTFSTAAEEREEILETEKRLVAFRPKEIRCFHRPNSQFLHMNQGYLVLAEGGKKTESTGWSVWKLPEPELAEERSHANGIGEGPGYGTEDENAGTLTGWRIVHELEGRYRYSEACVPDNLMTVLQVDAVAGHRDTVKSHQWERIHFFQLKPDHCQSDQSPESSVTVSHPEAKWPFLDIPFLSPKREWDNVRYKVYPGGKLVLNIRQQQGAKVLVMIIDWKRGHLLGGLSYIHDDFDTPAFGFGLLASDVLMMIRRRKVNPDERPGEFFMSHQCSLDTYAFSCRLPIGTGQSALSLETILTFPDGMSLNISAFESAPLTPLCSHLLPNPRRIYDGFSCPTNEPLVEITSGFFTASARLAPITQASRGIFVVQIHGKMKPSDERGEYRPSFYWYLEYSRFRRDILALARHLNSLPEKAKSFEWSEWTSSAQISADQLPDTPSIIGARAFSWWPCGQGNLFRPWNDQETVHEFSTRDFAHSNRLPPSDVKELKSLSTTVIPCPIAPECPSAPPELLELRGADRVDGRKDNGKGRRTDLLSLEGFDVSGHGRNDDDGENGDGGRTSPLVHEQVLNELSLHRDFHQVLLTRPDEDKGDAMAQKQFNPECDGRWIVLHFVSGLSVDFTSIVWSECRTYNAKQHC
ncbi:hypothetical protein IAR55_001870 [Kwoniella newhampshirensis]|uniref:F-box domain-containing protein n=1 Tax=Kwoniella newhampshirensis TaxID=1651941 RepID=A0AAW0Z3E6_9TREE